MLPTQEQCVRACRSRDARFDGWFIIGVTSTGVYCRPSCPTPVPPKSSNMRFYPSTAAAQRAGFRACKRCRPDASPGSPAWSTRADLVGRALRLIADGMVDRDGVPAVARALAISERHLGRLLTEEVGAGPLALARAQRAQTARTLIETTELAFSDVAFAAGFSSVRQFNDTIREVFALTPRDLRRRRHPNGGSDAPVVCLRLAFRAPFTASTLFDFLAQRAIAGIEAWDGTTFRRSLRLPNGHGRVALSVAGTWVRCELALANVADTQAAVQRCRRLLDLDADPVAIDTALAADPVLTPLVRARPGMRSPGAVDATEALTRAVVGQQVSVAAARAVLGRIVVALGDQLDAEDHGITHTFPSAATLAEAPDEALPMPSARRTCLREACRRIAAGEIAIDAGADRDAVRGQLTAVRGIGEWTAEYIAMRSLGDPDAFPAGDLGVRQALNRRGVDASAGAARLRAERWRPWRAYATHHLWNDRGER
jgi:AraC family transcriptional regulator of adaptative response / DNA-3-methyladenine glycosylase II